MALISQPKRYRDLDLNFTSHPVRKDVNVLTDDNAIIASVRNLLFTNFYERPFQYNIGSGVRDLLFEPTTSFSEIRLKQAIELCIRNFEPRVSLTNVVVSVDEDNYGFNVRLEYVILNKNLPVVTSLFLERIR